MSSARRAISLVGALCLCACTSPVAEVIVVVRADAELTRALRSVRIEARRVGATTVLARNTYDLTRYALPGQLAIIAADPDDARPLEVQVYADVGDPGRGDFTHRVVTRFQRNAVLYLDVPLADACRTESIRADCASLGLTCGEGGRCVSVERPAVATPPSTDGGVADGSVAVCRPRASAAAPTSVPTCERALDDAMERCGDGLDNDCDGVTDEGCCARSCDGATDDALAHCREERIAGGSMTLGEDSPERDMTSSTPEHPGITVSAYRIDAYEVTVARFRRFVAARMPAPPASAVMFPRRVVLRPDSGAWTTTLPLSESDEHGGLCNWTASPGMWESNPINCVDWYTAMAFCVWDGGRLPTEAEWEFAARYRPLHDDSRNVIRVGRRYPWGDRTPDCNDANYNGCDVGYPRATRPVGTSMNGLGSQPAWLGLYDMAGNVDELVADAAGSYSGDCWNNPMVGVFSDSDPLCTTMGAFLYVKRGGNNGSPEPIVRSASRAGFGAGRTYVENSLGFRCVRLR